MNLLRAPLLAFSMVCVASSSYAEVPPDPFAEAAPYVAPEVATPSAAPAPMPTTQVDTSALTKALTHAYMHNPSLKAAREAQATLEAQLGYAEANFKPNIAAGVSAGRERTKRTTDWNYENPTSKSVTLSQPLFRGGRSINAWNSAKERIAAGKAQLTGMEQSVLFATVAAYADVVEKQSVLELARSNLEVLSKHLEVTNARFSVGELTQTDTAQAEARVKQAETELRQSEGNLKIAHAGFERVVGYAPENLLAETTIPTLPTTLEDARNAANENPELLAATKLEEATAYDASGAYGALLPEVSLDGSLSRSKGNSFLGSNFDDDSVKLNVRIPLYQSGAEYARIREAESKAKEQQYKTMDTKLAATETATKAFEDYQTSRATIESTKSAINAAETARNGVKQEHEYGTRTLLDVLDAEQEVFANKVQLVRFEHNSQLQAYRLLAATGKLTAENLNLPVEAPAPSASDSTDWFD
jgi:outer membrane protein